MGIRHLIGSALSLLFGKRKPDQRSAESAEQVMGINSAFVRSFTPTNHLFIPKRALCKSHQSFLNRNRLRPTIISMAAPPISAVPGETMKESQPARSPITSESKVLVIGASRGLGLEFVAQAAARGAQVFATVRDVDRLPPGLSKLCAKNNKIKPIKLDVTNVGDSLIDVAKSKLTHVIHNAGIIGRFGSLGSASLKQDMMEVFAVNAVGVVSVAGALAPHLKKVKGQLPVYGVLSSKVGSVDDNGSGGMYAYRASKSACNNIVKSLSIDLARNVAFVLLHPGYVRTDVS